VECSAVQIFKRPTPVIVFALARKQSRFAHFWQGAQPIAPAPQKDSSTSKSGPNMWCICGVFTIFTLECASRTFSTSQLPRVVRDRQPLILLTCERAPRHNNVHFSTSQPSKLVRMCKCFCMLISKRGSRHSRVHFFNDSTSKSAPMLRCFSPVHFEVCFAPQQHPLFEHLNLQKCSRNGVFCTLCIRILLCATTACTFSTSQFLPVSEADVLCAF